MDRKTTTHEVGALLKRLTSQAKTLATTQQHYVKVHSDFKCPFEHTDRLFRDTSHDLDSCFRKCTETDGCDHFSVAATGPYEGVCMGCKEGIWQEHADFVAFDVVAAPNPAHRFELVQQLELSMQGFIARMGLAVAEQVRGESGVVSVETDRATWAADVPQTGVGADQQVITAAATIATSSGTAMPTSSASSRKLRSKRGGGERKLATGAAATPTGPVAWNLDRLDQSSPHLDASYFTGDLDGDGVHVYALDTGAAPFHAEYARRLGEGANLLALEADRSGAFGYGGDASTSARVRARVMAEVPAGAAATEVGADGHFAGAARIGDRTSGSAWEWADCHGHGTAHVGTAVGSTYGVAKGATAHAVRVLGCDGRGWVSEAVAGVEWALAHTAQRSASTNANTTTTSVISFGLTACASHALLHAMSGAVMAGAVVVRPAGNTGDDPCFGAGAFTEYTPPGIVTAGATALSSAAGDTLAPFSDYGHCIDVFAPGTGVRAAAAFEPTAAATAARHHLAGRHRTRDGRVVSTTASETRSGTGSAAAHVAGAAALWIHQLKLEHSRLPAVHWPAEVARRMWDEATVPAQPEETAADHESNADARDRVLVESDVAAHAGVVDVSGVKAGLDAMSHLLHTPCYSKAGLCPLEAHVYSALLADEINDVNADADVDAGSVGSSGLPSGRVGINSVDDTAADPLVPPQSACIVDFAGDTNINCPWRVGAGKKDLEDMTLDNADRAAHQQLDEKSCLRKATSYRNHCYRTATDGTGAVTATWVPTARTVTVSTERGCRVDFDSDAGVSCPWRVASGKSDLLDGRTYWHLADEASCLRRAKAYRNHCYRDAATAADAKGAVTATWVPTGASSTVTTEAGCAVDFDTNSDVNCPQSVLLGRKDFPEARTEWQHTDEASCLHRATALRNWCFRNSSALALAGHHGRVTATWAPTGATAERTTDGGCSLDFAGDKLLQCSWKREQDEETQAWRLQPGVPAQSAARTIWHVDEQQCLGRARSFANHCYRHNTPGDGAVTATWVPTGASVTVATSSENGCVIDFAGGSASTSADDEADVNCPWRVDNGKRDLWGEKALWHMKDEATCLSRADALHARCHGAEATAAGESGAFICDASVNFVGGKPYSQLALTDGCRDGVCNANPKYGGSNSDAKAKAYCKARCHAMGTADLSSGGCKGFFYQRHGNGHEICGFFASDVRSAAKQKHGHPAGAVCQLAQQAGATVTATWLATGQSATARS